MRAAAAVLTAICATAAAQENPYFEGYVDLWTPVLHMLDPTQVEAAHRRGEEVWFYVCCVPRGRVPNLFIDQPAVEHRLLFWMAERFGLDGFLYWRATFWETRDPWTETRSLTRRGTSFGCGDGTLLYPPVRRPGSKDKTVTGPVESIRWEMLRDGIEDREYFFLLRGTMRRLSMPPRDRDAYRFLFGQAREMHNLPQRLVRSITDYENDPAVLHRARALPGATLEALSRFLEEKK